jgi:hypothetical protein
LHACSSHSSSGMQIPGFTSSLSSISYSCAKSKK